MAVKRPTRNLRSQKATPGELVPLFDVSKYTSKEIKHFKYSILTYISEVLSEESFVDEVRVFLMTNSCVLLPKFFIC